MTRVERKTLEERARAFVEDELQITGDGRKARRLVMEFEGNQSDGTGWAFCVIAHKVADFARPLDEALRNLLPLVKAMRDEAPSRFRVILDEAIEDAEKVIGESAGSYSGK